jgi:hypothetical protein
MSDRMSPREYEREIAQIDELLADVDRLGDDIPFGLQVAFEGLANKRSALIEERERLGDQGMVAHDLLVKLEGKPVHGHSIDADFLSELLGKLQDVARSFVAAMAGRATAAGPIPQPLQRMAKLRFAGSFAGSFGMVLETADEQRELEITGAAPLADALSTLLDLLESGADRVRLLDGLGSLGERARSHYRDLLQNIAKEQATLEVVWPTVSGPRAARIKASTARRAAAVLAQVKEETEYEVRTGLLTGANVRLGTFELVDDRAEVIAGRISRQIPEEIRVGQRVTVHIHVTRLYFAGMDRPKRHYRLDEIIESAGRG